MPRKEKNTYIMTIIESWPQRLRKAKIKQKDLCKDLSLSPTNFSKIINLKVEKPHDKTLNKVENYLKEKGV